MPMSYDEIFAKIRDALVDALAVEPEEVTPQAKLTTDLNAESIDFLDIVFRLEKTFGIKVERGELFPEAVLNDPNYVQGGKVTPMGMAELEKRIPFVDLSEFKKNPSVQDFMNIFSVDDICKFVQHKLAQKGE